MAAPGGPWLLLKLTIISTSKLSHSKIFNGGTLEILVAQSIWFPDLGLQNWSKTSKFGIIGIIQEKFIKEDKIIEVEWFDQKVGNWYWTYLMHQIPKLGVITITNLFEMRLKYNEFMIEIFLNELNHRLECALSNIDVTEYLLKLK